MIVTMYYDSPIGGLQIDLYQDQIREIHFLYDTARTEPNQPVATVLEKKISTQLQAYFSQAQINFELPLLTEGTDFQQRVWKSLRNIPVGQTRTYGQLAKQLNSSAQAVGNACRQNKVPIIVPCHRVVAAHGVGGFSGQTVGQAMEIKYWLLRHEGIEPNEL
ncbi:MAG: methylated-DNA--[protein]-cysteine S-methyltransferase [Gammaproteobacteria bacterium]|nr:methylated-DNA--[protein]-cysteine S-methyltransferase [Gammaproteobacteria bacterium]